MEVLQLYVNCCVKDSGELFDFNTQLAEQREGFKASLIHLQLPNHHSPIYYFLHKSLLKFQDKFIEVERCKQFRSNISKAKLNPKNYILLAGIKLYYEQNCKGKKQLRMQCFSGRQVPTGLGNFQIKQEGLPFMIAKSFKNGIALKRNQILKLGRLQFSIQQMQEQPNKQQYLQSLQRIQVLNLDEKNDSITDQDSDEKNKKQIKKHRPKNADDFCRICYTKEQQKNNILIHPCNCTQSVGSVHIDCFKYWMNVKMSKINADDRSGGAYHTNLLFCEICKQKLPKAIKINGETIPILNLFDDFKPYLGLIERSKQVKCIQNNNSTIYVTTDQSNKADIGRLFDNGIILDQITVSRKHAQIVFHQNQFYLKDTDSKFGTLVYEKQAEIRLSRNMKAFQIKNTVFSVKVVKIE